MATTLSNAHEMQLVKGPSAMGHAIIITYPEGTSETFARGDLVIYDESEDGVVGLTACNGVPDSAIFGGISLAAASGTAGDPVDVLVPQAGDVFSAILASANDTATAPVTDDRLATYGLIKMNSDNNDVYAVDSGNTTWVICLGPDPRDLARVGGSISDATISTSLAAGDRVLFRFREDILGAMTNQA